MTPTTSSPRPKALRRHFGPFLLLSGIAILGYAGFQYGAMLFEQRHLQAMWREQQKIDRSTYRHSPMLQQRGLTRISIPSIGLSAVVVEGTDVLSLLIGPGHLIGTSLPGEPGNAVISAHRDTFFRNIKNVTTGDRIVIEREGQTFTYSVEGFRIVKPDDLSVVAPTSDTRLTLVTCDPAYYPGPAPKRLVMFSKLVTQSPLPREVTSQTQPPMRAKRAVMKPPTRNAER